MTDKSREVTNKSDFRSSIPEFGDEQILSILKKRSQYQKEAADLAIQEAIKRGLINSEQDLFAEEFNEKPYRFSFFPLIENEKIKNKTRKSIARILLIIGAVPAVWGVLEIFKGEFVEGFVLLILGLAWVYSSFKLMSRIQIQIVNLLTILLLVSVAYIVKLLIEMKGLEIMDYFIPFVFYALIIYSLLFLRRLK